MNAINLYSNKKANILAWLNAYTNKGYTCRAIERTGMNGRPGQSKYCLSIYHPAQRPITQEEFTSFETEIFNIYKTL